MSTAVLSTARASRDVCWKYCSAACAQSAKRRVAHDRLRRCVRAPLAPWQAAAEHRRTFPLARLDGRAHTSVQPLRSMASAGDLSYENLDQLFANAEFARLFALLEPEICVVT